MLLSSPDGLTGIGATTTRTEMSRAFEAFYRTLPTQGACIPNRSAFRPERAARFLKHIVLCEAVTDGAGALRMRLVGSEFQTRLQRDVKGQDYFDYLMPAYRDSALQSIREIVQRPCGLWQIMPVHYERGFAQHIELTVLPLGPGPDGMHLLLVLTQPMRDLVLPESTGNKAMAAGTALTYRYLDLGAGAPL
ncbi:MAG: PAS domain-containing protein [Alphaproteobacteria bacterium]|nr:PAS domain-containing protein [Alphaproteobacteria bacterium]